MQAQSTPGRKDLLNVPLHQYTSTVEIKTVTMSPGQAAPRHLHPCAVTGYIVSGQVLFQVEGEESKVLNAGEAFYEPRNRTILHFDNASKTEALIFVAFYMKEKDEELVKIIND